jgi:hypothetical protein
MKSDTLYIYYLHSYHRTRDLLRDGHLGVSYPEHGSTSITTSMDRFESWHAGTLIRGFREQNTVRLMISPSNDWIGSAVTYGYAVLRRHLVPRWVNSMTAKPHSPVFKYPTLQGIGVRWGHCHMFDGVFPFAIQRLQLVILHYYCNVRFSS